MPASLMFLISHEGRKESKDPDSKDFAFFATFV
ncbi:hypothetical protein OpiT1DRAFT_03327 [Opitutaceae bacterium TAV1]|nr:hypothetical protein OpiT1DRAFT_03327 [Opitutaceae bacterium TAV1]